MAQRRKTRARKPKPVSTPGQRRVDLRDLIPKGTILTMPDGEEAQLPAIGSDEMAEMLMLEELMNSPNETTMDLVDRMRQVNQQLNDYLQRYNPGLPFYSFPFGAIPQVLTEIIASGSDIESVSDEVREAIAGVGASDQDALDAAQKLAESQLDRQEGEDRPLASAKRSQTRTSRSATTASGGRNGGSKPPGRSRKRTSSKSAANKSV
jgi:hypothetical protein